MLYVKFELILKAFCSRVRSRELSVLIFFWVAARLANVTRMLSGNYLRTWDLKKGLGNAFETYLLHLYFTLLGVEFKKSFYSGFLRDLFAKLRAELSSYLSCPLAVDKSVSQSISHSINQLIIFPSIVYKNTVTLFKYIYIVCTMR